MISVNKKLKKISQVNIQSPKGQLSLGFRSKRSQKFIISLNKKFTKHPKSISNQPKVEVIKKVH